MATEHRQQQAERDAIRRAQAAIERDQREGRYFPLASEKMKENTWACQDGKIVRRTADGWLVSLDGQGNPGKCRTTP